MPMTQYLTTYDLVKGKRLADRYTIVGARRQSGFAAAYEATDAAGERCEVSLFPAGLFDQADQAEEFRSRLVPWREIESPHVLRVREVLSLAGGLLLVTDLPVGEGLRERMDREKRLSEAELVTLGTQLLEGLGRIHGAGLVHGDIKPRTIHVSGKGAALMAMLVDGGITPSLWNAKGLGEKTALIGTPYYAPAEQFGGEAADVRSDIYNLATVLYECATGVLPWTGASFLEVFQSKLKDPPPMKKRAKDVEVAPHLEAAILHACQADRRKRYGSAREFQQALNGRG
ncbi:MAG: serine/threonine protein kinase [Planctomycetes bacterium]|nr:serine/threonine protein kinase [Planctomycetota bacterium]